MMGRSACTTRLHYHQPQAGGASSPPMEVVDFWHVTKQDLLLVLQGSRYERDHGWIVHLRGVALFTQPGQK